jgi:hypothetical protein
MSRPLNRDRIIELLNKGLPVPAIVGRGLGSASRVREIKRKLPKQMIVSHTDAATDKALI